MSKLLPLVTNPAPSLREKSREITLTELSSPEFLSLCGDMAKTMKIKDGIGLAAPQIGRNIRLIVINTKDGDFFLINPQIIKKSWNKESGEEGCLSVPNVFGKVKRHKKIQVSFLDKDGTEKFVEAQGMMARVLQHEIDHLDGILFIDKAAGLHEVKP